MAANSFFSGELDELPDQCMMFPETSIPSEAQHKRRNGASISEIDPIPPDYITVPPGCA
jgi:hypothetical protein